MDRHLIAKLMEQKLFQLMFKLEWNTRENFLYIQYRTTAVANGSQLFCSKKNDYFVICRNKSLYNLFGPLE
jgi:hypothetical protein